MKHALMLGNILNKEETKEAQEELRELPGGELEKWGKKAREAVEEKRTWRNKGKPKDKTVAQIVGSSQPWVQILRAKWVDSAYVVKTDADHATAGCEAGRPEIGCRPC